MSRAPHVFLPSEVFGKDAYGYGWEITPNFYGSKLVDHGGSVRVYTAHVAYLPERKVGVSVLANSGGPRRRILVLGTIGSGKTTCARRISERLGIPCLELDSFYWEEDWINAPDSVFRERVLDALKENAWVVDGMYPQVEDIILNRADTVVWLDYTFCVIMSRLIRRTFRRIITQEELSHGNREYFGSGIGKVWWAIKTHRRLKREYACLFRLYQNQRLLIRLESPTETSHWLFTL
jgi:adenylate kinase family enzyme